MAGRERGAFTQGTDRCEMRPRVRVARTEERPRLERNSVERIRAIATSHSSSVSSAGQLRIGGECRPLEPRRGVVGAEQLEDGRTWILLSRIRRHGVPQRFTSNIRTARERTWSGLRTLGSLTYPSVSQGLKNPHLRPSVNCSGCLRVSDEGGIVGASTGSYGGEAVGSERGCYTFHVPALHRTRPS